MMNILFDLDGTLTDPFEGITKSIMHALSMLGRPAPPCEDLKWCIGPPLQKTFAALLGTDDRQLNKKALALYRERFSSVGLFENRVYEDIPGVLDALIAMGHTLYVATAKPEIFAERIIDHFSLRQHFRRVYGSELDGTRTDKTSLVSYILENESIPPSDTFVVGDRKHDIIGAKENSVCGLGVLWGYGTREELEASGACAYITQPSELISVLKVKSNKDDTPNSRSLRL